MFWIISLYAWEFLCEFANRPNEKFVLYRNQKLKRKNKKHFFILSSAPKIGRRHRYSPSIYAQFDSKIFVGRNNETDPYG